MGRPYIETRSTRWPLFECGYCRQTANTSLEAHHRHVAQMLLADHGQPLVTDWRVKGKAAIARIEWGIWKADCPVGCKSTEYADPDWRVFVCSNCGAGPFEVVFPKQRAEIEATLIERPVPANRGWYPHETLAALRKETAAHAEEIRMALR
jgi:hypothetical protein